MCGNNTFLMSKLVVGFKVSEGPVLTDECVTTSGCFVRAVWVFWSYESTWVCSLSQSFQVSCHGEYMVTH